MEKELSRTLNEYLVKPLRASSVPLTPLSTNIPSNAGVKTCSPPASARQLVETFYSTKQTKDYDNMSLAFQCLYKAMPEREDLVNLVRKHQYYVVFLNSKMLHKLALAELCIIYKTLTSSSVPMAKHYETLLRGPSPNGDFPLSMITSFHLFVFQSLLHMVSSRVQSIIKKNSSADICLFWKIATAFLKDSNFDKCLQLSDSASARKYYINGLKMLSGFLKVTEFLSAKLPDVRLKTSISALKLKIIEYKVLTSTEITIEVPFSNITALNPFVRDLREAISRDPDSKYSYVLDKISNFPSQELICETKRQSSLSDSKINPLTENAETKSFDFSDEKAIVGYVMCANACPATIVVLSGIFNSIKVKGIRKSYDSIIDNTISFLEKASIDETLFKQCLIEFVPLFTEIMIQGSFWNSVQSLSCICFEYSRQFKSAVGFFESCKIDLACLSSDYSPKSELRILNRIEYSICSLLDLGEPIKASSLTENYVAIRPKRLGGEALLNIIATCISLDPNVVDKFFGVDKVIESQAQISFFNDLLSPLKSKLSEDASYVISNIISALPATLSLETRYKVSHFFDVDVSVCESETPIQASEFILEAGIRVNRFKKGKLRSGALERIETYVLQWLRASPNAELIKHFVLFEEILSTLFHMGFYNRCAKLIEEFKSSDFSDSACLFRLELLLGLCLLEVPEIVRLPQVLKHSGMLAKSILAGSCADFDAIVNLKLTQFEYFVKMRDEKKSKFKFEEAKSMIARRPEYNLLEEGENLSLQRRLRCLVTVARFSLLTSMLNMLTAEMLSALRNLKLSIKLLSSILRKLDSFSEYSEIRLCALGLLSTTYKCAFKVAKHLGLSKEAICYVDGLTKINSQCCECPLRTLNSFISANYFTCLNKRTEALEEFSFGSRDTWDSKFLKLVESITLIRLTLNDLSRENIISEKERIIRLLRESETSDFQKQFVVSYSQISEIVSETEASVVERIGEGFLAKNQESLSVIEMLMRTISSVRMMMSDVSTSAAVAYEIKRFDSVIDIIPNKMRKSSNSPKFDDVDLSRIIECKSILLRFGKEEYLRHLETGTMIDVNALLMWSTYLLSLVGTLQIPEVINSLQSALTIKDLAYTLPYSSQRALFKPPNPLDCRSLLPELNDSECLKSLQGSSNILSKDLCRVLPDFWVVVTLDICQFSGDLVIARLDNQSDHTDAIKIPFDRKENEKKGFREYLMELKTIISESNRTTKSEVTSKIVTKEDRKIWWAKRFELDSRLGSLLQKIEKSTIGGLVGCFNAYDRKSPAYQQFEIGLNKVWKRAIGDKSKFVKLDEMFVQLFYHTGSHGENASSEFELLADLTDFIIDKLELTPALEADVRDNKDHIMSEIHKLLLQTPRYTDQEHLILIPSHSCGHIPWESMTFLRNRSVSRMPSVRCLVDSLKSHGQRMTVPKGDRGDLLYVVNPGSDLRKTQMRFEPVLSQITGSKGIAGESPSEDWLTSNLYRSSVFIYLGHGGGEQYLRSSSLFKSRSTNGRDLPVALLMGCSSAAYHDNGCLQPSSNIYNWLVCGAPAVMTNLWDVTDKDIDIFSLSLLAEWGLVENIDHGQNSLASAMVKSRDACTLKFLNGAAPILHGLPLKLN